MRPDRIAGPSSVSTDSGWNWTPAYAGVQFHPESVLTEDGPAILSDLIAALLPATPARLT
jgi:hypothetical protein